MSEPTVLVTIDGHVATVAFNRPHRANAWTGRMYAEYKRAMQELNADENIRAIVVTGTGRTFSVGGDSEALAGHAERGGYDAGESTDVPHPGIDLIDEFNHDLVFHYGLRVPVVAAINGACAGIALALTLFCDIRFIAANAKCTTAAPKLGLPAEYGMSWTLPRLIGITRANDLMLSGRVFTGDETREWGLWNGVGVDGEHTLRMAQEWARNLATTAGPNAVVMTKTQIYRDYIRHNVGASVEESVALFDAATKSAEYREGVAALREKRAPHF